VIVKIVQGACKRQKKWESPPVGAENFPIHVPFPVPVVSFTVEYAVIEGEKTVIQWSCPVPVTGSCDFCPGPGPKTKICRF